MPVEVKSAEEFLAVLERASECRVKLGRRGSKTVLKVKARTPRRLYTLVFEDVDRGIDFVKEIRSKCKSLNVLDPEIEEKLA